MVPTFDPSVYYDLGPLLSRNGLLSFVVGGRGIGKSYSAKRLAIKAAIDKDRQFILLRRYETETKESAPHFFADVGREFPDHGLRVNGRVSEFSRNPNAKKPKWHTAGYFTQLSNSESKKSVSYANVHLVIYEEFIIPKRSMLRYLPNETDVYLDFLNTVDRYQNRTRGLFLANSVTIMNPYFHTWDIRPDGAEWQTRKNGLVVCHFPQMDAYAELARKSRLGRLIDGTSYADYAVGNVFRDNHDALVESKTSRARYLATVETGSGTFAMWWDSFESLYFCTEKRPAGNELLITLLPESMDVGKQLVGPNSVLIQRFRSAYSTGRMRFDTAQARNAFAELFVR